MATKTKSKATAKAEPARVARVDRESAADTDAARLKARGKERARVRKAQGLAQGEKDRQAARAEIQKIRDDSAKAVAKRRAAA